MTKVCTALNFIFSPILDKPLKNICSDKKSIGLKVVSGIGIGILSILSGGLYTIYIYKFFDNRKAVNLQKEFEEAVDEGDCEKVKELFKKYPSLKIKHDVINNVKSESLISIMLPLAAEKGHLDMIKLLHQNGATLDAISRGQQTALDRAMNNDHGEIARYLIENGAKVEDLHRYFAGKNISLDMMIFIVNSVDEVSSENKVLSVLALASTKYDENPEKCKELIRLLIDKGDRLVEGDLKIPEEAKNYINQLILEKNHLA